MQKPGKQMPRAVMGSTFPSATAEGPRVPSKFTTIKEQLALHSSAAACSVIRRSSGALLATLLVASSALAQSEASSSSKAEDTPALPYSATTTVAAQPVGAAQVAQFRKLLLPELLPLVRAGVIELEALARTRYDWSLAATEQAGAPPVPAPERELAANGELPPAYRLEKAPLFDAKDKSGALNPTEMLWNSAAARWSFPVQATSQTISWYRQGKFHREFRVKSSRLYPAKVSGVTAGIQLFRERFAFETPAVLKGLALLTYRFLGSDEDLLWAYSPAISKARQLTGSSHADSIIGMPLSLSDLAVWNSKQEASSASVQLTQEALVPVAGVDLLSAVSREPGCYEQQQMNTRPGADLISRWTAEGRSVWGIFSALSYFVPRQVVRIELESRDPFSEYGRQVLTVDRELGVPLLKLVYDRSGHPWKLVMGSLGLVQPAGDPRRVVVYPLMVVHDYLKDETVLLTQTSGTFCDGFSPSIPEAELDLRSFTGQGGEAR